MSGPLSPIYQWAYSYPPLRPVCYLVLEILLPGILPWFTQPCKSKYNSQRLMFQLRGRTDIRMGHLSKTPYNDLGAGFWQFR